jgi:hypothetical protein
LNAKVPPTTAQSLGALLKSARDIMRKDKGLDTLQAEVDALKRLQAETAAELAALLPAILDRAFRGGL